MTSSTETRGPSTEATIASLAQKAADSFRHTGKDPGELLASAWIGVEQARKAWDTGLAPFEAFAYLCARHTVIDQLRQEATGRAGEVDLPELVFASPEPEAILDELETMLDEARVFKDKDRRIAQDYWALGYTQKEVASIFGILPWKVHATLTRIREAIRRLYVESSD